MEELLKEINRLRLDCLSEEWVENILQSEFLEYGEIPCDYEMSIEYDNIKSIFLSIMRAVDGWLHAELESIEDRSWADLSPQIKHQNLLALLAYFIDFGGKNIVSRQHRNNAILASRLYYKLLCVPGYKAYHIYHSQLFTQSLVCLNYPKAMCDNEDNYFNTKELTREVNSVIKELGPFVNDLRLIIPNLHLTPRDMNFEDILSNLVDVTGGAIVNKLNIDKIELVKISSVIYEMIDILICKSSGEPNPTAIQLVFKCLLPKFIAASIDCRNANNVVKASYVTYSGVLLTKYGKAALPGYIVLLQHLCYTLDGLERAEVRSARVSLVEGLMTLLPQKSYKKFVKWLLKLSTTAKVSHRQVALEMLAKLLYNEPDMPKTNETETNGPMNETNGRPNQNNEEDNIIPENDNIEPRPGTSRDSAIDSESVQDFEDNDEAEDEMASLLRARAHTVSHAELLRAVYERVHDASSTLRTRALSLLADCLLSEHAPMKDALEGLHGGGEVSRLAAVGARGVCDERAAVRRAAAGLLQRLIASALRAGRPPLDEDYAMLVGLCRDASIVVRSAALGALGELAACAADCVPAEVPTSARASPVLFEHPSPTCEPPSSLHETTSASIEPLPAHCTSSTDLSSDLCAPPSDPCETPSAQCENPDTPVVPSSDLCAPLFDSCESPSAQCDTPSATCDFSADSYETYAAPCESLVTSCEPTATSSESPVALCESTSSASEPPNTACDASATTCEPPDTICHSPTTRDPPATTCEPPTTCESPATPNKPPTATRPAIDAFLAGPMYRLSDPETKIQEQVVTLIQQLLIDRLQKYDPLVSEDRLPWEFLAGITRHNMRKHLQKACALLAKSSNCINHRLVDLLSTHLGVLSDERDLQCLVLLTSVARHVDYSDVGFLLDYYYYLSGKRERDARLLPLTLELVSLWSRCLLPAARTALRDHLVTRLAAAADDGSRTACASLAAHLDPDNLQWATELLQISERRALAGGPGGDVREWLRAADVSLVAPSPPSPQLLCLFLSALTQPPPDWSEEERGLCAAGAGRLCVRSRAAAAALAPPLAQLLRSRAAPLCARLNALLALTDICTRYSCIVEPLLDAVCGCVARDAAPPLRRAAARALTRLLLAGYLRLRTPLYYRYCALLADEDHDVREPAEYYVSCCLTVDAIYHHFVDCVLHYNNEENEPISFDARQLIYDVMLQRLSLVQKLNVQCRLAREVLEHAAALCDEHGERDELPRALHAALLDAITLLCGPRMKLPKKPDKPGDADLDDLQERVTTNIVSHKMKRTVAEVLVPAVLRLYAHMRRRGGQLAAYLVRIATDLLSDYRHEIEELIENDEELVERVQQFQETIGLEASFGNARNLVTASAPPEPDTPRARKRPARPPHCTPRKRALRI